MSRSLEAIKAIEKWLGAAAPLPQGGLRQSSAGEGLVSASLGHIPGTIRDFGMTMSQWTIVREARGERCSPDVRRMGTSLQRLTGTRWVNTSRSEGIRRIGLPPSKHNMSLLIWYVTAPNA